MSNVTFSALTLGVVTGARVAGFSVCTILGLLDGLGVEAGGVGSCVG